MHQSSAKSDHMANIREKAEGHCKSFGAAMALRDSRPSATTTEIAEAFFDHYLQTGFVSFTLGTRQIAGTKEEVVPYMAKYFDIWVHRGLGLDVRMEKYRVEPVSPSFALCYVTWRYFPPAGSTYESWAWESLYAFRILPGQERGYWEFCVTDNETSSILQRFPDFYEPLRQ